MKNFATVFVCLMFACVFCTSCKQKTTKFRVESVTFYQNGSKVTVSAEDLKNQMPENYEPNGGLFDNYFFVLIFSENGDGKAIFVFSELGDSYKDTYADSFTVEEKSGGRITLTFTNGQTLSGEKSHRKLYLSGGGVSYIFEKK